jgi:hypothetical protein
MSVKIKIQRLNESKEKEVLDEYKGYITLNITTIRREKEIATSESTYTGEFLIRIVLKHGQSLKKYLETVLKPRVRMIDGVSLQSISDLEKVN